jgi:glycerol dehydrogenase-like iron-containing ADH family enzyme
MLAHFWECLQIASGKIPEFHGAYVGVATLLVARFYNKLAKIKPEEISKKAIDKEEIYGLSGILAPAMRKLNKGSNIPSLEKVKTNWQKIKNIILAYPGPEEIFEALKEAGSPTTTAEVVISDDLKRRGWISHPFIRNRFTLTRLMSHYNLI